MNQKCNKLGHDQKPMEYFCLQQKQILWSCEKCQKESKQKLNFQSIKHFQSCIQDAKGIIIKETENERIEQMKFEFDTQVQKVKDLLEFYLSGIENQVNTQYAELSAIIQFVDNFNIKSLDSPNPDHFQYTIIAHPTPYLQLYTHNNTSFNHNGLHLLLKFNFRSEQIQLQSVAKKFDQLQMQINQLMQKILSISMDINEQVGFLSESIFLDQMKLLIKKFDLPLQFQKYNQLQIPKQYCLEQSHQAQFVFKEQIDGNTSYIGQQENDEFNGKGLLYLSNKGLAYYGAFMNGQFCYGISLNVQCDLRAILPINKKELLLGEFEFIDLFCYRIQNYGILLNSNCERYEGDFKDNLFDGYGQFHYQNGDLYKGQWKAGKRFGQGELINHEFGTIKGNFVDGQLNGKGELNCQTQKYFGDFKDNEMDGEGTLEDLVKKTKYVGSFKKGVKCGQGTLFFSDNRKIEGNFQNNEPCGQCVETTINKYFENLNKHEETTIEEGEYFNGLKCGQFNCQTTCNGQIMKKVKYYRGNNCNWIVWFWRVDI